MPNCLFDFIGLEGCTTDEPLSGVSIQQYPGISTELMDKVASQDQVTYKKVWNDTQTTAFQKLKTDIQTKLLKFANARLDQVLFQTSKVFVQQWQQTQPLIGPAEKYRGCFASIAGGKYLGLRVKNAYIFNGSDTPVEVTIKYFQTQDATLLYEKTVTLQPKMNTIPINKLFYSDYDKINIAQLVDCTNLTTLNGTFIDYGWNGYNDDCIMRYNIWFINGWNNFPVSAPLDFDIGHNFAQNWEATGIYWDAELICSVDAFICSQKYYLIDAWARLLCAELLRTKLASNRVNYFTQSNRELTERNQATFLSEYQDALDGWAQQLNLKREGLCFNCDDSMVIRTRGQRP